MSQWKCDTGDELHRVSSAHIKGRTTVEEKYSSISVCIRDFIDISFGWNYPPLNMFSMLHV